jgi:deoxycytidine triphosphate deaminase
MTNRQLPEKFGVGLHQLIDSDIKDVIGVEKLIFQNSARYDEKRVRPASYELTLLAGRNLDFSPLTGCEGNPTDTHFELPAYNLTKEGVVNAVVLNPLRCCLIRTREQIALPDNVEGKVFPRGQLFQLGLIVESTYIDPGYNSSEDRPGIHLMVFNATHRSVTLPVGTPVARLELVRLAKEVAHPHPGANNIGGAEQVADDWPWPAKLSNAEAETKGAYSARDRGARMIAMDRQTHALKFLIDQVDSLTWSKNVQKLFMYWCVPWMLWLVIKALNVQQYLSAPALKTYEAFQVWINGGLFGFLVLIIPIAITSIKKDVRDTVMVLLRLKADK